MTDNKDKEYEDYLTSVAVSIVDRGVQLKDHTEICDCWRCQEARLGPDELTIYRARMIDPLKCLHPEDDKEPISGDGWLCGLCGSFVSPPIGTLDIRIKHD